MTVQRKRRGQKITLWPRKLVTNNRGEVSYVADLDNPIEARAVVSGFDGSRAEVAGQVTINTYTILIDADIQGIDLWARCHWQGDDWDIVTPPMYRHGTRHVRHSTLRIRERPREVSGG